MANNLFISYGGDEMFDNGFPYISDEIVNRVVALVPPQTYGYISTPVTADHYIDYFLGQTQMSFPYRLYSFEVEDTVFSKLDFTEKMILHCIYTRSCDGYIRERHVKALLAEDFPEWTIPYIFKVCDEYIIEILQIVYDNLKDGNTDKFKSFCANNQASFCKSYHRMISYWNVYYRTWDAFFRNDYYRFEDYVGRKLFIECFGAEEAMKYS